MSTTLGGGFLHERSAEYYAYVLRELVAGHRDGGHRRAGALEPDGIVARARAGRAASLANGVWLRSNEESPTYSRRVDPGMTLSKATSVGLLDALVFAADKHRGQKTKGGVASPYINHPIAVAHLLAADGGVDDRRTLVAAILHDTLEKTDTTLDELRERFGRRVADVVAELTDDPSLSKKQREDLQVAHAPMLSKRAKLVKLADKIANLLEVAVSPPKGWSLRRRRAYFDWGERVVDGLRGVHPGLEAIFDRVYALRP